MADLWKVVGLNVGLNVGLERPLHGSTIGRPFHRRALLSNPVLVCVCGVSGGKRCAMR